MRQQTSETTNERTTGEEKTSVKDGRTVAQTDPVGRLQRRAGNQALQRLARRKETESEHEPSARDQTGDRGVDGPPAGSVGLPLSGETRREMERAFGQDFGGVRVHDGVGATVANRTLAADAYATDTDVVLRPDRDVTASAPGRLLLAHELAHVAQFRMNGDDTGQAGQRERRTGTAEREARTAALAVAGGGRTSVTETPPTPIAASVRPWWQRQFEGTIDNVTSLPSKASDAASTVASGAESAWSSTKDAYWGTVDAAADRMVEYGPLGSVYRGMQENAASIRPGGVAIEEGIDSVQDDLADGVRYLANDTGPFGEFGAEYFDQVSQAGAGLLQFGTTVGSNTLQAAANPVDATLGIEQMIAHSGMPGSGAVRAGRKLRQGIFEGKGVGTIANEVFNPQIRRQERQQFSMQMADAFIEPYRRSVGEDGDYMQGISRGAAEALTFWRSGITKSTRAAKFGNATPDTVPPGRQLTGGPRPAGQLPGSQQPSGLLPSGQQPAGALPGGSQPAGLLPGGSQPAGILPGGSQPAGLLPGGSSPAGLLPGGSKPAGLLPGGSSPAGLLPGRPQPAGLLPGGSQPAGLLPGGSRPAGLLPGGTRSSGLSPGGGSPAGLLPGGQQPAGLLPGGSGQAGLLPGGSQPSGLLPSGSAPGGLLPSGPQPAGLLPGGSGPSGLLPGGARPAGLLPDGSPAGLFPRNSRPAALPPGGSRPAPTLDAFDNVRGGGGGQVIDMVENGSGRWSAPMNGMGGSGGPAGLLPGRSQPAGLLPSPESARAATAARGVEASSQFDPAGLSEQALKTGVGRYQNSDIPEHYEPEQRGGPETRLLNWVRKQF